jgi:HAE1 family hydrophobic/amphiphilic exporter-1
MGLTRLAVTRPLAILMFIIALVLMGLVSFRLLRVDRMPAQSFPYVMVGVSYSGASPSDVETLIAEPLEAALAGLPGVVSIGSTSSQGRANINLQFAEGVDTDKAAIDVERRVASIRGRLPADAGVPSVNKMDPNAQSIMNIAFTGPRKPEELYDIADQEILPRLQSVLGVADVSLAGGRQREIQLQLDFSKMEGFGLTVLQVSNALTRENISVPAGTLVQGRQNIAVRSVGLFQTTQELGNLIITSNPPTGTVYLKDIATVISTYKQVSRYQRFNGNDSIGLSVTKQAEANSLQVADDLIETVRRVQDTLPEDTNLVITNDSARFTRAALDAVEKDLLMAVLLCGFVLLLFLHTWRNTLIVVLAIPTSLISTFLVMYALGFSLNTMSLLALALMIGILVDDSIVVLENIHRHLHLGEPPWQAALKGRSEIGLAAIAITLTDVVVYIPVAFMQGNIGRMFKEYGLTIAAATLFSLFISFTLTPMLASRWLKANERTGNNLWDKFTAGWERGFDALSDGYSNLIGWALRFRPVIVMLGIIAVAASLSFLQFNILGSEYAPQEDDNNFRVDVQMPAGTSLEVTDKATRQLEAQLSRIPQVVNVFSSVGSGGFGGSGTRSANVSVELKDKRERDRTIWEIMAQARQIVAGIPEMSAQVSSSGGVGGMGRGGNNVRIEVTGDDLETLREVTGRVEQIVRQVPGITDVRSGAASVDPEVRAVMDRKKMAELGITASQVASTLRTFVSGQVVTQFQPEGQSQTDITIVAMNSANMGITRIADIPVAFQNGVPIRLGQVATLKQGVGPTQISRQDRKRVVTLNGVVVGRSVGDVAREMREALKPVSLPLGYAWKLTGSVSQMETTFAALLSALALSVIMVYMLMVALFESWVYPLVIMFSLPVSLIGAFGALLITGNTFNLFSLIGLIMLMGLVAKNAILLVDYTNTLRSRGMERNRALMEAGRTRLRPILMTTATIVAAMIPLALKLEAGAESRSPMAVVVIGGVISSTLLTLVLVPVMYTLLDALQVKIWHRQPTFEHAADAGSVRDVRGDIATVPIGGGAPNNHENGNSHH